MIHKFTLFDTNVASDVNSGSVHVVDTVVNDVLDCYEHLSSSDIVEKLSDKHEKTDILEALEEIDQLIKKGLIFSSQPVDIENAIVNHKYAIKAMCLHICHDCNLRCKYCFASTGSFGGKRMFMSIEVAKRAIDFLIQSSGTRVNLEIDFFGGEPLLNFDVVKYAVKYAKEQGLKHSKKFRFTITTNALLLDNDKISYIDQNMDSLILSLDGRPEINDGMRIKIDGSGSHEAVLSKIMDVAKVMDPYKFHIRGTYTKRNLDFSNDVLYLAQLGFKQISVEPMVGHKNSSYAITEQDLPIIFKEYEKLAHMYVEMNKKAHKFNFFHFILDSNHSTCLAKKIKGCGSGFEYVAISPDGDIYPCHQFVGIEKFKLGNLFSDTFKKEISEKFKHSNICTKSDCINCWNKFYCSGGCAANAYSCNGSIHIPDRLSCELQKKRTECALWVKTQLT